jgi:transcriptional regulator with XRE-family HTH domain
MSNHRLAASLLRFRRATNMSQRELAAAVGVHQTRVSSWERGIRVPTSKQLDDLSVALNVDRESLVADLFVVNDVERALIHDPHLSDDDRHALLTLYLSLARQPYRRVRSDQLEPIDAARRMVRD